MKRTCVGYLFCCLLFPFFAQGQFTITDTTNLTIIVTDGTVSGKDSPLNPGGGSREYNDPIRPLGMTDAIQAGAFLDRPRYGKAGFLLVFCRVWSAQTGPHGFRIMEGRKMSEAGFRSVKMRGKRIWNVEHLAFENARLSNLRDLSRTTPPSGWFARRGRGVQLYAASEDDEAFVSPSILK